MNNTAYYEKIDQIVTSLCNSLNQYIKCKPLHRLIFRRLVALMYAVIIDSFFKNLTVKLVKDEGLPWGQLGKIKDKYKSIINDIKPAKRMGPSPLGRLYYNDFRQSLSLDYPKFLLILDAIEDQIAFEALKKKKHIYLRKISATGIVSNDLDSLFKLGAFAVSFGEHGITGSGLKDKTIIKFGIDFSKETAQIMFESGYKDYLKRIDLERSDISDFQDSLYDTWKTPIDLTEILLGASQELSQNIIDQLTTKRSTLNAKQNALLKLHARAIRIGREVLTLIKAGYPDGAIARWRSLHEIAVIAFFLQENKVVISKRFLEHQSIIQYKRALEFNKHCDMLGYHPIEGHELSGFKKEVDKLCKKYGNSFSNDYGWLPKNQFPKKRNFYELEKRIKIDWLRPYFSLACDALHGGSKGFYCLGLTDDLQDYLFSGYSSIGLNDPIRNTAISINQISVTLTNLNNSFTNLTWIQFINFVKSKIEEELEQMQN